MFRRKIHARIRIRTFEKPFSVFSKINVQIDLKNWNGISWTDLIDLIIGEKNILFPVWLCMSGRWSIKGICAKLQSAKRTTPFSRFSRPPKTPVHPLHSCGESSSTTGESERSTKGPTRRNTGGYRRQRPRYVRTPAPTNAIDDHTSARPLLAELRVQPGGKT